MPQLQDFVGKCDWTGAMTLLEFQRRADDGDDKTLLWMAYCSFHLGDYAKALDLYDEAIEVRDSACGVQAVAACGARLAPLGSVPLPMWKRCSPDTDRPAGSRAVHGREPWEGVLHVLFGPAQGCDFHRGGV